MENLFEFENDKYGENHRERDSSEYVKVSNQNQGLSYCEEIGPNRVDNKLHVCFFFAHTYVRSRERCKFQKLTRDK